jgi:mannose-6-phosphate isomerase-like protein (cupin superfamily)
MQDDIALVRIPLQDRLAEHGRGGTAMAIKHDPIIQRDGLGGSITILERGDDAAPMRFRMVLPKGFGPPAKERHPEQREEFHVLRGTLDLGRIGGKRVRLMAGQRYCLPAGVFHLPANAGDDEVEFEATLSPGRDAADMFIELYTATREHRGLDQLAHVMMVFRRYRNTISFAAPVRLVMTVVAGLATLFGARRTNAWSQ